jgi:hypothetical protein
MNLLLHEEMVRQRISDLHEAAHADHMAKASRRHDRARVHNTWRRVVGIHLVDAGLSLMGERRNTTTLQLSK